MPTDVGELAKLVGSSEPVHTAQLMVAALMASHHDAVDRLHLLLYDNDDNCSLLSVRSDLQTEGKDKDILIDLVVRACAMVKSMGGTPDMELVMRGLGMEPADELGSRRSLRRQSRRDPVAARKARARGVKR